MKSKIIFILLSIFLTSCSYKDIVVADDVYGKNIENNRDDSKFYEISYYDPYYYNYSRFGWNFGVGYWSPGWNFGWGGYYYPYMWNPFYYGYFNPYYPPWWYSYYPPGYYSILNYNFDNYPNTYYGHRSSLSSHRSIGRSDLTPIRGRRDNITVMPRPTTTKVPPVRYLQNSNRDKVISPMRKFDTPTRNPQPNPPIRNLPPSNRRR